MIIDIYSDVVCPWCYIGKRNLEQALARAGRDDAEIVWRAYQLNPDMPREGLDRDEYLMRKFGTADAGRLFAQVVEAARQAGLELNFEAIGRAPNTLDAHRLTRYARESGCQDAVVEALFRAYFVEGRDVGDRDVLADVAAACGLDQGTTREWLAGEDAVETVHAEDAYAREMGIQGVPTFLFERRYPVTGAQPVEAFLRIFDKVEEKEAARAAGAGASG